MGAVLLLTGDNTCAAYAIVFAAVVLVIVLKMDIELFCRAYSEVLIKHISK